MWSLFPNAGQFVLRSLVCAAVTLAAVPVVHAAEYLFTPRVDQRFAYDDNLQLNRANDQTEALMYRLTVGTDLAATGDRWRLDGGLALEAEKFDEDAFDTDNQFANLGFRWFGERSVIGISGGISRQAQRTAELEGSGLLGLEATRVEQVDVRPSYQLQISELYQLTLGASFNQRKYETANLTDYESYGLDLTLARQMSARTSISLSVFAQEFETEFRDTLLFDECSNTGLFPVLGTVLLGRACVLTDGTARESTTYGLQIGMNQNVSEKVQFNVSIGAREVESRDQNSMITCLFDPAVTMILAPCNFSDPGLTEATDTSTGVIARSGLEYRGERWRHIGSLERSITPVALGFLVETDSARLRSFYQLRPTMTANADITYLSSGAATSASRFDRDYVSLQASLNWRISENWRIVPGVRWREQDKANLGFDPSVDGSVDRVVADSVSAFININYRPKRIQISR